MTRYSFNLHDGTTLADTVGSEHGDLESARREAVEAMGERLRGRLLKKSDVSAGRHRHNSLVHRRGAGFRGCYACGDTIWQSVEAPEPHKEAAAPGSTETFGAEARDRRSRNT